MNYLQTKFRNCPYNRAIELIPANNPDFGRIFGAHPSLIEKNLLMEIKSPPISTALKKHYQDGITNIFKTSNWLNDQHRAFFKKHGITPQQYNVLRILHSESNEQITINTLKDRILDKNGDVSRLVDRLELKNLITRKQNPNDRRSANLHITEKGVTLSSSIESQLWQIDELLTDLSEDEIIILNTLLLKIQKKT